APALTHDGNQLHPPLRQCRFIYAAQELEFGLPANQLRRRGPAALATCRSSRDDSPHRDGLGLTLDRHYLRRLVVEDVRGRAHRPFTYQDAANGGDGLQTGSRVDDV